MAQGKITDKQQEILEFIKQCILAKGYPPSVREIANAVGLKSTSTVHGHLQRLEKRGLLHRDAMKPRAMGVLKRSEGLQSDSDIQVHQIPVVGNVIFSNKTSLSCIGELILNSSPANA